MITEGLERRCEFHVLAGVLVKERSPTIVYRNEATLSVGLLLANVETWRLVSERYDEL
jgi:hypothetical protein